MLTASQEKEIRDAFRGMRQIAKTTKDAKERFYYYGQMDGILNMLRVLGLEIDFEDKEEHK